MFLTYFTVITLKLNFQLAVREQELFFYFSVGTPRGAPGLPTAAAMWLPIQGEEGGRDSTTLYIVDGCNEDAFLYIAAMNSHSLVLKWR